MAERPTIEDQKERIETAAAFLTAIASADGRPDVTRFAMERLSQCTCFLLAAATEKDEDALRALDTIFKGMRAMAVEVRADTERFMTRAGQVRMPKGEG